MRPSRVTRAFQAVKELSSSSSSSPRSARRTGWTESKLTRYWYHEMSHAIVITSSRFTPESGRMLARGSPRLFGRGALEERGEPAPPAARERHRRRRRAALFQPAMLECDFLAE